MATSASHSVREFCNLAFSFVNLNYEDYVTVDPVYFRTTEDEILCGDASKAKKALGWNNYMNFEQIVQEMVESDLKRIYEMRNH